MNRLIIVMTVTISLYLITGCKELIAGLLISDKSTISEIQSHSGKVISDLRKFDRIYTHNDAFYKKLNTQLKAIPYKSTFSKQLKQEIDDTKNYLIRQNEQFKDISFSTSEVANLRNEIMQLNYDAIQILALSTNPERIEQQLNAYFIKQKQQLHRYNIHRDEIEAQLE